MYYTQKGFKLESEEETVKSTQGYVELPVLASYRYALTDDIQLQINAGPYFAVRLSNKEDPDYHLFTGGSSGCVDAGVQAGAGILYAKHYYAGVGYEWGFVKQEKTRSKNKNLFINIGYNF